MEQDMAELRLKHDAAQARKRIVRPRQESWGASVLNDGACAWWYRWRAN